ncbi:MAG TPA: hypothetical protein VGK38_08645 [Prolixibacteraceae bacterium]
MKNLVTINENDIDCTNVIFIEDYPLCDCGFPNKEGKIVVRGVATSTDAQGSHIDQYGVLHIVGEAIITIKKTADICPRIG